jgi:hypothetical protein
MKNSEERKSDTSLLLFHFTRTVVCASAVHAENRYLFCCSWLGYVKGNICSRRAPGPASTQFGTNISVTGISNNVASDFNFICVMKVVNSQLSA